MKYTTYKALLEFALEAADSFSLVWGNFSFDRSAYELIERLSSWIISDYSSSSWPGTELGGGKARVKTFEVNTETIEILKCVDSVFDFKAPKYPEDLAFYSNGKVIFASVAHEGEAWFET